VPAANSEEASQSQAMPEETKALHSEEDEDEMPVRPKGRLGKRSVVDADLE